MNKHRYSEIPVLPVFSRNPKFRENPGISGKSGISKMRKISGISENFGNFEI
jgi:hypothetical protein